MLALLMYLKAKAQLDKFWSHQAVDFTADLTRTGNRPEEVIN